MNVLIVDAGYIGSHMVKMLGRLGCSVTMLDAVLSRGFDAVMHFASFIQVGESVQQPAKYYQNNVVNTLGPLACFVVIDGWGGKPGLQLGQWAWLFGARGD